MKTTKPAVILLLALLLLTVAATHPVVAMVKPKISNTQTASCLVKITTDEAVLPLNEFAVDYLLRSSGVAGKAAREVLDISPDIASELIEIEEIFGVDSLLGGIGGGVGGMGLPAYATPGASTPGASRYPTTTTSRSTRPTTPTTARTSPRPSTTRTPRPGTRTTIPTRTTTPTRPKPRTPTSLPPRRKPTVTQPPPSTTEQTILFRLLVDFDFSDTEEPIKPAAEEFMVALIDNLRIALRGAFEEYRSKLDGQLKHADEEARQAEIDLVEMQDRLRDISGSRDLSRNVILRNISEMRQKLQSNMMDMTSYKSTIKATTRRIADTESKIRAELAGDTITNELREIIKIHEEKYTGLSRSSAPPSETREARENLAKAKIELAKRREELSKSVGGNLLSTLNQLLADVSIQENETMGQIENFQKQIVEAEQLLSSADEYELVSLKADIARQNLEETLLWRARLGRNIRSVQPPDVTVIGAE